MGNGKPHPLIWLRKYSLEHRVRGSILFLAIVLVVTFAWVRLTSDAFGATPHAATQSRSAAHKRICKVSDPDVICPASVYADAFQHGYYDRAPNGVPVNKIWNNPANARDAWVDKIATYMNNHQRAAAFVAPRLGLHRVARTCNYPSCWTGLAKQAYDTLMERANCVSLLTPSGDTHICDMIGQNTWITVDSIKNFGSVALCGGTVALGVFTRQPQATMLMGGAGACWGAWLSWSGDSPRLAG